MNKLNAADLPVQTSLLTETPIRGDINIEQLIFRQIERTYLSALQDEAYFAANVRLLLSSVPSHKQVEIFAKENEYTSVSKSYQYKYWCGVPIGTPENPINGSPYEVSEDVVDWHKLFELILKALEECGVTWEIEKWTIEAGKVDAKSLPIPTPNLTRKLNTVVDNVSPFANAAESQPEEPEQYKRPCAICGNHVHKGTGKFYLHKLVHKKQCLDLAKVKWKDEAPE